MISAFQHGWDCYIRLLDQCPFQVGTEDYYYWIDGYKASHNSETSNELREAVKKIFYFE